MARMTDKPIKAPLSVRRAFDNGQQVLGVNDAGELDVLAMSNDWRDLDPGAPSALCRGCDRIVPVSCFRSNRRKSDVDTHRKHQPDCVICEDIYKLLKAMETIWLNKARHALREHMEKERKEGLHNCQTLEEYQTFTGVTVQYLADRERNAWENNESCEHCESVGHRSEWQYICPVNEEGIPELDRMTVDRVDPTRPLSRTNLQLLCKYGNTSKHRLGPHVWEIRNRYWRRYNALMRDTRPRDSLPEK